MCFASSDQHHKRNSIEILSEAERKEGVGNWRGMGNWPGVRGKIGEFCSECICTLEFSANVYAHWSFH